MKNTLGVTISLLVILVLSGCAGELPASLPTPTSLPPTPTPKEVVSAPVPTDTAVPDQSAGDAEPTEAPPTLAVSELPEPTATSGVQFGSLGFSLGDPNLKATNVQSVNLQDGGKPKIVEFFAYW